MSSTASQLALVHFNDVYHIEARHDQKEPAGGAARFVTLVNQLRTQPPPNTPAAGPALVMFSGDAFNPSTESSFTRGKHMVPVLNALNMDVACYGNHDFDFGVDVLEKLSQQCNFPWLLSNVLDAETGDTVAHARRWHLIEHNSLKIGIIGIVEPEWLETLPSLPPTFQYHDFIATAKELSARLRSPEYGVDLVIALTHMRLPNDVRLAAACPDEIDLILGGHDHMYAVGNAVELMDYQVPDHYKVGWQSEAPVFVGPDGQLIPAATYQPDPIRGLRIVKSGTDFRDLSHIGLTVERLPHGRCRVSRLTVQRHAVTSAITPDPDVAAIVQDICSGISKQIDKVVCSTLTPWDARSQMVRTEESAIGNLLCDLMRNVFPNTDVALACGGAIRSDSVYGPGDITMRTIMDLFPFEDPMVVVRLTGAQLTRALENGFSKFPAQEGRFPQVAGLRVQFDPRRAPGSRVVDVQVQQGSTQKGTERVFVPLDLSAYYNVATRLYMAEGHDGYDVLKEGERVVDDENGILVSSLFRRYFLGLKYTRAIQFKRKFYPQLDIPAVPSATPASAATVSQYSAPKGGPRPISQIHHSMNDSDFSNSSSEPSSVNHSHQPSESDLTLNAENHPQPSPNPVARAVEAFSRAVSRQLTHMNSVHESHKHQLLAKLHQSTPETPSATDPNETKTHHSRTPSLEIVTDSVHHLLMNSCASQPLSATRLLKYTCQNQADESHSEGDIKLYTPAQKRWHKLKTDILIRKVLGRSKGDIVKEWCTVAPVAEGRIINLTGPNA
ncbi:hypothetical protein H4R33_007037 [Dimargaris cristalligena]|nr:hypothetical protein H4R33_007037 [Dimargaris cristalligena]